MAFSGTYSFAPSLADLILNAYGRIQLRRTELTTQHLSDAAFESNLTLAELSTLSGPNLWAEDTQSVSVAAGTATYSVDPSTVTILIAYLSTTSGNGQPVDRVLGPMSTIDYQSLPNKTSQGFPTAYWFSRTTSPQITLWPVPDATQTYTLTYRRWRQIQDATVAGGLQVEVPLRMIDAFTANLAARLAQIWKPEKFALMRAESDRAWGIASAQDTETGTSISIVPQLGGYYGR